MIKKRQTLINAAMSITQFLVLGGTTFVLYRFLLRQIGVENLGLWSVVISTTSITGVANLGLAGGVVKFVAQYAAHEDHKRVIAVIETAFLSLGAIIGILLLLLYPLLYYVLGLIVSDVALQEALHILPLVVISFWILTLGQVFQSGLDGYQRIDARSLFLIVNTILYLLFCFVLVPKYKLVGLAWAHLLRNMTLLVGSRLLLFYLLPTMSLLPYHWNRTLFREMLHYGVSFQVISVIQMMLDPITKSFMAKFGGLSITGYYEMAYRMATQLRGLLVSANSVLVPVIADLQEHSSDNLTEVYERSFKLLIFLSLPFYGGIIAITPIVSQLLIGNINYNFVLFSIIITVAYFINTLAGPAYFTNLGTGKLRDNVISHLLMGVFNGSLGYVLGRAYGGYGVVIAWALAIVIGSVYLIYSYSVYEAVSYRLLVSKEDGWLAIISLLALFCSLLVHDYSLTYQWSIVWQISAVMLAYTLVIFYPLWHHSMRPIVQNWVISLVPARYSLVKKL